MHSIRYYVSCLERGPLQIVSQIMLDSVDLHAKPCIYNPPSCIHLHICSSLQPNKLFRRQSCCSTTSSSPSSWPPLPWRDVQLAQTEPLQRARARMDPWPRSLQSRAPALTEVSPPARAPRWSAPTGRSGSPGRNAADQGDRLPVQRPA